MSKCKPDPVYSLLAAYVVVSILAFVILNGMTGIYSMFDIIVPP